METIDCTPTWEGILPALLLLLNDGDIEGKKTAKAELSRMAKIADEFVNFTERESDVPKVELSFPKKSVCPICKCGVSITDNESLGKDIILSDGSNVLDTEIYAMWQCEGDVKHSGRVVGTINWGELKLSE